MELNTRGSSSPSPRGNISKIFPEGFFPGAVLAGLVRSSEGDRAARRRRPTRHAAEISLYEAGIMQWGGRRFPHRRLPAGHRLGGGLSPIGKSATTFLCGHLVREIAPQLRNLG